VDLRVTARSPFDALGRLDLTAEIGVGTNDPDAVETLFYLRRHGSGQWVLIERFPQPPADTELRSFDVPGPNRFVGAGGQIVMRILLRSDQTFTARADLVRIVVAPPSD
jgi:hypothetical protein